MKEFLSNSWVVSIMSGIIVFFLTNAIIMLQNKKKHKKQNATNKMNLNRLKCYIVNNKAWYKKLHTWIPTIAAICTTLGVSIFGGKSLFGNGETNTSLPSSDLNIQKTFDNDMEEKYHKGNITKTGWESKFIGLRYTNPKGMVMSTEEELDGLIELYRENLSNNFSEYELGFIKLTTTCEMMSKADDQSTTVMICVEKLMNETDVFQYVKEYELQLAQFYPVNYILISDNETVKIGNKDCIRVSYIEEYDNAFMYMDSYFRVVDDRVIMISIIFNDEGARDNVLNAFTTY